MLAKYTVGRAVGGLWAVGKFQCVSTWAIGEHWSFFQFATLVGRIMSLPLPPCRDAHILIPGTCLNVLSYVTEEHYYVYD